MKVVECPHCGHAQPPTITICPQCGTPLRRTSKHRAIGLIEGAAGIGKTTLVDGLMQRHLQLHPHQNTLLRLGQGHTYAPLDPDGIESQITADEQLAYLNRIHHLLDFLAHPTGPNSTPPFSCLIETLHLTLSTKPHILSPAQLVEYDRKLAAIGCKLIFIRVTPETLWERCIWQRRHNGFIIVYGQKYGRTLDEIHAHYVAEQAHMLRLFEESTMPKILLDGELSNEELIDTAYDFWIR
ncbi:MAG: hypothetical protein R3A44_32105 [Caldilineaceae bacterium]